jgi:nucleoside 2-deoxyribosyltransferase
MPVTIPGKSIKPPQATCLVITPFDAAGSRIKDTIQRALDEIGIRTLSLDNLSPGAAWVNAVTDAINFSDFIVVDVSRQNPNIMYELGYAHALRKHTILIMDENVNSPLPSDLQGSLYITYDSDNFRDLRNKLMHNVQRYIVSGGEK